MRFLDGSVKRHPLDTIRGKAVTQYKAHGSCSPNHRMVRVLAMLALATTLLLVVPGVIAEPHDQESGESDAVPWNALEGMAQSRVSLDAPRAPSNASEATVDVNETLAISPNGEERLNATLVNSTKGRATNLTANGILTHNPVDQSRTEIKTSFGSGQSPGAATIRTQQHDLAGIEEDDPWEQDKHQSEYDLLPQEPIPENQSTPAEIKETTIRNSESKPGAQGRTPPVHTTPDRPEPEPIVTTGSEAPTPIPNDDPPVLFSITAAVALLAAAGTTTQPGLAATVAQALRRWFWSLVGLFANITRGEGRDHPTRAKIFALIQANPGICHGDLCELLDLSRTTARHHLTVMERTRRICNRRIGNTCHYYPRTAGREGRQHAILLHSPPRRIAERILLEPGIKQKNLCEATGISPTRVHEHLTRLAEADLVSRKRNGNANHYYPSQHLQRLLVPDEKEEKRFHLRLPAGPGSNHV